MAEGDNLMFREQLLSVDGNLGKEDVEALKFLCHDFISLKKLETVKSALDIFQQLITNDLVSKDDTFLIAELLYRIKCNFLLQKLGCTKENVQAHLLKKGKVSAYRQMLYEVSEELTTENVKEACFLLGEHLSKKQSIKTALELLTSLEKKDLLAETNVTLLEEICQKVAPEQLKKIEMYKQETENRKSVWAFKKLTPETTALIQDPFLPKYHEFGNVIEEHTGSYRFLLANQDVKANPVSVPQNLQWAMREDESQATEERLSQYKMDLPCRGYCFIINNINFEGGLGTRNGSQKDAMELDRVFTWLGFKVKRYDDKTSEEIAKLLQGWQSSKSWKDCDCLVCCILSHGESGKIYGTDACLIPIRTLMSYFTANQCPLLAQKPKLFFIQACQGQKTQQPVYISADVPSPGLLGSDAKSSGFLSFQQLNSSIPAEADFLLGMATVDGYLSFRHVQQGTWYIQALCNKLQLLVPRGEDILSILTEVNEEVSKRADAQGQKKQMPQPAYTLTKKLIFPVPGTSL